MNAAATPTRNAPVKATWICLVIAWVLFIIPLPGVGLFVGWPLNLVAFILAIVVMARGRTAGGLIPLLASIIVSPLVYFVGLAVLGAAAVSGDAYQDYKSRAEAASAQQEAAQSSAGLELKPVAMEVTAADLFAAYEANEVSADDKYKGRQLAVTGTVAGINKDVMDAVFVEIATPNGFSAIHARGIEPSVAAGLTKGSQITVVCEGDGLLIGSPQLDECSVR